MLLNLTAPVAAQPLPLDKAAGRVLAQGVAAVTDMPPFSRSPYDGYAFRAKDTAAASRQTPVTLKIIEEVPAGRVASQSVTRGTAVKILTGAPLPPGADAVAKFEDTAFTADEVTLYARYESGGNVCFQGEDVRAGQTLATAGDVIDAGLAGALAAQGVTAPLVYRKPRVAVISIGSELAAVGEAPGGGRIPDSNRYTLQAAVALAGGEPAPAGTARDDAAQIGALMEQALDGSDIVIATGGVSVGDYDLTPAALDAIGATVLIRRLRLKPGGMCVFAQKGGKLLCCLSGNPASSMTAFYAVALPVLRRLCGRPALPPVLRVALRQPFPKPSPSTRLLRGRLVLADGTAQLDIGAQGNGMLGSLIGCDALAEVPAGSGPLEAGAMLGAFYIG